MRLLVTRPEPDAERTAQALRACGHVVTVAPMLTLESVDAGIGAGPWAGVVVTSSNALRLREYAPALKALPLLAVGPRTAEAATAAGFAQVTSADGDVASLLPLLVERFRGTDAPLLYLAAQDRAHDVAALLAPHGIACTTVVIYRMVAAARLPEHAAAALAGHAVDGVLHYSRRTAETYIACVRAAGLVDAALAPTHFCLAPAIGALLTQAGAARVELAARPDEASLLELISPS